MHRLIIILIIFTINLQVQAGSLLTYMGSLITNDGNPETGSHQITFQIYLTENANQSLWSETITIEPDEFGNFTAILGVTNPITENVFDGGPRYLGITIGNNSEMTPRQMITSVPQAMNSIISNNSLTTEHIADGTIKLNDLSQNNAQTNQIIKWDGSQWTLGYDETGSNDGEVTSNMLADSSVNSNKIMDGTITDVDISETAAISVTKLSGVASLTADQILNGSNTFNGSIEVFSGEDKSYAIKVENNMGGNGAIIQSNSDNEPSLLVISGVTELPQAGEPNGGGPLIEAWTSQVNAAPYMLISNRIFSVENNGDVLADGSIMGGGTDFAELVNVNSHELYEIGDVIVIDENDPEIFRLSSSSRSKLVAGVISEKPGFLGRVVQNNNRFEINSIDEIYNSKIEFQSQPIENKIILAMIGIVTCKVTNEKGNIEIGDLLVSSSLAGHAMRDDNPQVGTVIGKALERMTDDTGVIKILLTLQ